MAMNRKKVAVIGGGITGLTAAYYLQKEARQKKLPLDVTLIEGSHRLGGKMQTYKKDGYVIERGPDSFLERKASAGRLITEVGLKDQLVNNTAGKSYVLVNDKLHPMPGGSVMGIPTEIGPFVATRLFSPLGKLRAAGDFVLPKSSMPSGDQSLGQFFRRRVGNEVLENLIEPLLSGIYAGDIDKMSLMATFPSFYQLEQKYGSLILGMKKTTPKKPKTQVKASPKGIFQTLTGGLQSLADAIEQQLTEGSVILGDRVVSVEKFGQGYEIKLSSGTTMYADSIVMAVPYHVILKIFPQEKVFAPLKQMTATSVANVALAFDESVIKKDIDGTGFVVSRNGDYTITAITWTHKKWPHSTPKGKALLRLYVGRPGDEACVDLPDEELIDLVLSDLNKTMNITDKPELYVISRWKEAMPQYNVGHRQRVDQVKAHTKEKFPGMFLCGASFNGIGLPDCIDQGEAAVKEVLSYLQI